MHDKIIFGEHLFFIASGCSENDIRQALEDTLPWAQNARLYTQKDSHGNKTWTFVDRTEKANKEFNYDKMEVDTLAPKSPKLDPLDVPVLTEMKETAREVSWDMPKKRKARTAKKPIQELSENKEVERMTTPPTEQPAYPPVAVSNDHDGRMALVMRGMKEGAIKAAFDGVIKKISGPIAEKITESFKGAAGSNAELLVPAVELAVEFIIMLGVAEAITYLGPMMGKVLPGDNEGSASEKSRLLAIWMRKYAGEKVGAQVVEAAIQWLPMIMGAFSHISLDDMKSVVGGQEPAAVQLPASAKVDHKCEV